MSRSFLALSAIALALSGQTHVTQAKEANTTDNKNTKRYVVKLKKNAMLSRPVKLGLNTFRWNALAA